VPLCYSTSWFATHAGHGEEIHSLQNRSPAFSGCLSHRIQKDDKANNNNNNNSNNNNNNNNNNNAAEDQLVCCDGDASCLL
jgi:hypothetical protein